MNQCRQLLAVTLFVVSLSTISNDVAAFEIDTHARMTFDAYKRSSLVSRSRIESLGLLKSRKYEEFQPFGTTVSFPTARLLDKYYDLAYQPSPRFAKEFDHHNHRYDDLTNGPIQRWGFAVSNSTPVPYFIGDWLARGAVREDDQNVFLVDLENTLYRIGLRQGDPNTGQTLDTANPINRFCNHFYDPVNNRPLQLGLPLSLFGCGSSEVFGSAVQWSLGSSSVDGAASADTSRKNSFSILDAREAMWRALTGTDGNNAPVPLANSRAGRDAYWATTFRALGGVVHNLQDMGQPQHTRNEAHAFGQRHLLEEHVNNHRSARRVFA